MKRIVAWSAEAEAADTGREWQAWESGSESNEPTLPPPFKPVRPHGGNIPPMLTRHRVFAGDRLERFEPMSGLALQFVQQQRHRGGAQRDHGAVCRMCNQRRWRREQLRRRSPFGRESFELLRNA